MTVASVSIKYESEAYLKAVRLDGRPIISVQVQTRLCPDVQNEENMTDKMKKHLATLYVGLTSVVN